MITSSQSPIIEVISIDPNCEYDSSDNEFIEEISDDDEDENVDNDQVLLTVKNISNNNDDDDVYYRNRTESSSIGDYESHSSDDEINSNSDSDDDVKEDDILKAIKTDTNLNIKPKNEENKNVIIHDNSNKNDNDMILPADDLENFKDFDLTEFITKDYYNLHSTKNNLINTDNSHNLKSKNDEDENDDDDNGDDNEEDSDIDIDVETIQEIEIKPKSKNNSKNNLLINKKSKINGNVNNSIYHVEDDLDKDPSWSPSKIKKSNKIKNNEMKKSKIKNNQVTTTALSNTNGNMKSILKNKIVQKDNSNNSSNIHNKQIRNSVESFKQSSVILDRKIYGLGRGGKNISMCCKESPPPSSSSELDSDNEDNLKNLSKTQQKIKNKEEKPNDEKFSIKKSINEIKKINDNNVVKTVILSKSNDKINNNVEQSKQQNVLKKDEMNISNDKSKLNENIEIKINASIANDHDYYESPSPAVPVPPVKKKLNLEEYKKRRGVSTAGGDVLNIASKIQIKPKEQQQCVTNGELNPTKSTGLQELFKKQTPNSPTASLFSPNQASTEVSNLTSAKKKILEKLEKNPNTDPITEARNKVLRLKELKKKAALDRIIDSTVSAKVGPITKILPLEEIVKNCKNSKYEEKIQKKIIDMNEYEEIIIVSVSLNTDLTIPPDFNRLKKDISSNGNEKLNGASLFYNISDTLQKANSIDNVKISSNSLISSIQDIALKKLNTTPIATVTLPTVNVNKVNQKQMINSENQFNNSKKSNHTTDKVKTVIPEHGEDKIIMHLRKDRIRVPKQSISTQTLMLPQFPPLKLLSSEYDDKKAMKSIEKRRRRKYRSRRSSSYSSNNNDDENENSYHSSHSSSHHSRRSSSLKKRKRYSSYKTNDTDLNEINRRHHRSNSKDSNVSLTSSESGIGRRGRSRERRKRQRRYSSTSPGGSSSDSRSSSSSNRSRSSHSRSRSLSASSSSSSSSSRSSSRSSYTKSNSSRCRSRKSRSRSRSRYRRSQRNVSPG